MREHYNIPFLCAHSSCIDCCCFNMGVLMVLSAHDNFLQKDLFQYVSGSQNCARLFSCALPESVFFVIAPQVPFQLLFKHVSDFNTDIEPTAVSNLFRSRLTDTLFSLSAEQFFIRTKNGASIRSPRSDPRITKFHTLDHDKVGARLRSNVVLLNFRKTRESYGLYHQTP